MHRTVRALIMVAMLSVPRAAVATESGVAGEDPAVTSDFDGDGFADLAIGTPYEDAGATNAGVVNVLFGSAAGVTAQGNQLWYQDSEGILGSAEVGDIFGDELATGDFDGDGFADLAVGAPGEAIGETVDAGAVNVLYGSPAGLSAARNQIWHQDSTSMPELVEEEDMFGAALAAGDFDGDDYADLAVGVPNENSPGVEGSGAVHLLYGSPDGLTIAGTRLWDQDSEGVPDSVEHGDNFGADLAAANLGRGGEDDLAIGVPLEDIGSVNSAGAVNVLYGSPAGLTGSASEIWHQDRNGIRDVAEGNDLFGYQLAAANFGKGGSADLAIGAQGETVGDVLGAGQVHVLYGSGRGLSAEGSQVWNQDTPGVADTAETIDSFGSELAAADFGRGSEADLAIAADNESVGSVDLAGTVHVLYGTADGLTASQDQVLTQNGTVDAAEPYDRFGFALFAADFGNGVRGDLAAGIPGEMLATDDPVGAVAVLYGTAGGLSMASNQLWTQDSPGIRGISEAHDVFGWALP